jgi:hypothetical protein
MTRRREPLGEASAAAAGSSSDWRPNSFFNMVL